MPQPLVPARSGEPSPWGEALYALLAEKGRCSGSKRAVEGYARMLWPFLNRLGNTPDRVVPGEGPRVHTASGYHGEGRARRDGSPPRPGVMAASFRGGGFRDQLLANPAN